MEAEHLLAVTRRELAVIAPRLPIDDLDVGTSFAAIGLDSTDLAELVVRLEDATGVMIPDDELVDMDSVRDLAAVVTRLEGRRRR